jgi:hypothetical protein
MLMVEVLASTMIEHAVLESNMIEDTALESASTDQVMLLSMAVVVDNAARMEDKSTTWLAWTTATVDAWSAVSLNGGR